MANLLHLKASRTRILSSLPTKSFGKDGEIVISMIKGKGVYLCTKAGGSWYTQTRMSPLAKFENTPINITASKIKLKGIKNSSEGNKFVVSEGNGEFLYRNPIQILDDLGTDALSINYKTAYCSLNQYNNKEDCWANGGTWYYSENDSHDSISNTAENELLTIGSSIGKIDAESTLTYDGSILEIKRNTDFDDNWQTSAQDTLLKLSYDSSNSVSMKISSGGDFTITPSGGDARLVSTLKIDTIAEIGSDTDKILMSDNGIVKYVTGANLRSYIGAGTSSVGALNDLSDVTYSSGDLTITSLDTIVASGDLTIDADGDIELNANGGNITFKDSATDLAEIDGKGIRSHVGPVYMSEIASAATDTETQGQLWTKDDDPNNLMFTDGNGQDMHISINTAVWGGYFPRLTGADGKWLCIPFGYQGAVLSMGTNAAAPDTSYNPATTADDLGAVIWQSIHGVRVINCRIWYGQGGASNTRHSLCLMRYDIDTAGTLANGVEVAGVDNDAGSDDYTTLAFTDLTMTSDVAVTNAQVLIGMVYCQDAINAALAAKCIIEYQDLV